MNRRHLILGALCLLIPLTACHKELETQVERDLTFLCSEACWGRLPGSAGNDAARDYIAGAFEEAGLVPLQGFDSLLVPYDQTVFDMDSQEQTLTAVFPDGSSKTFYAGVDFYPYLGLDGGFSGEVTADPADPNLKDKIYLSADGAMADSRADVLQSVTAVARIRRGNQPVLNCPPAVFEQLAGCSTLTLEGAPVTQEKTLYNVAGVLPGKRGRDALLVTAHFDHVGGYGDVYYPGAFDNASGTALLLEILRPPAPAGNPADYDIVFIAFNGEDMGQLGSAGIVDFLPYQTINVINLDSIGLTENGCLGIAGQNQALQDSLISSLNGTISCNPLPESLDSDHVSFEHYGIPAVTVSSYLDAQVAYASIHHPDDTPDKIDTDFLSQVAPLLVRYIQSAALVPHSEPEGVVEHQESEAERRARQAVYEQAEAQVEAVNPPYDMLLPIEVDGQAYMVRDTSFLINPDRAEELIPGLSFPDRLGEEFLLDRAAPLYNSGFYSEFDQDSDGRHVSVRHVLDEGYELGVLQEITDPLDGTVYWSVSYSDGTHKLSLSGYERQHYQTAELLREFSPCPERAAEGGTLYQNWTDTPEGALLRAVAYVGDSLPYCYILYNDRDNDNGIDGDALTRYMQDIIPNLSGIPQLP